MQNDICALIVTYNRKELLKENLEALLCQNYKSFDIIIIDNYSTDGTKEYIKDYIKDNIYYHNTNKNLGGAGGFNYGLKIAMKANYKYAWIMDDDTIPTKEALESLIKKIELLQNDFSFLCSLVKFTNDELCKMNKPTISNKWLDQYDKIKNGLISINTCSFVSCLINLECAKKIGLPIKEFFIYGDDVEYTNRLLKCNYGYLDIDSIVYHKMKENTCTNIIYIEKERIHRSFYTYRNRFYIAKKNGKKAVIKYIVSYLLTKIKILLKAKNCRFKRLETITKGFWAGIFFNPKIEHIQEKK